MLEKFESHHKFESYHNFHEGKFVSGGGAVGCGFSIKWQNGPLEGDKIQNGAFVETIIAAVIDRLENYERTELQCQENLLAIIHLQGALHLLEARSHRRKEEGTEGTYTELKKLTL